MPLRTDESLRHKVGFDEALAIMLIALSIIVGRSADPQLDIALFAALALAALWSPPAGVVALVAGSMLSAFTVDTGTRTSLNFAFVLGGVLGVGWLARVVWRRDRSTICAVAIALCCLVSAAVLAFAYANAPWSAIRLHRAPLPAQIGGVALFGFSAAAFFCAADVANELGWLRRITMLFLIIGGAYVVCRIVPELHPGCVLFQSAVATGSLFWIWLVALAAGLALFDRSLNPAVRLTLALVVAGSFYVSLTQNREWVSGWLPPATALLVTACVGSPRFALGLLAAAAGVIALRWDTVTELLSGSENRYSLDTRIEASALVLRLTWLSPLLGLGPSNYYHWTPQLPIRGYHVNFSSHNNWVDVVAQTGLFGLASFACFFGGLGVRGYSAARVAAIGFPRGYACAACGGLAGTLVAATLADWVIPFVYNVGVSGFRASVLGWIFLGGLFRLTLTARRGNPAPS